MNNLQTFNNAEFGPVRTIDVNGEPYFVGKDVADILGYANSRDAISKRVDDEDKGVANCDTLGGEQELTIINESGLYSLILSSKLPNAKKFKRWVTSEVLPAIRKSGTYSKPLSQAEITAQIAMNAVEMEKKLTAIGSKLDETANKLDNTLEMLSASTIVEAEKWKAQTNSQINRICQEYGLSFCSTRGDLYKELEQAAACNLKARQRNLQERMRTGGATYKERIAITLIDVIARDKCLKLAFDNILMRWQAKYLA